MKLGNIYEGWRNNLFPPEALKEAITEMSDERMKVCEECPFISTKHKTMRPDVHCTQCGCTLAAKTKVFAEQCPLSKWGPLLTPQQEEEIRQDGKE